jgi:hypothetical protein
VGGSQVMALTGLNLPNRVWERIIPEPTTGCWLWLGTEVKSYPKVSVVVNGVKKLVATHRLVYEAAHGPLGSLQIDHKCNTPMCVNPDHLQAVTAQQNLRLRSLRLVVCRRGHPLTPDNIVSYGTAVRTCKTCRNDSVTKSEAKRKARRQAARASPGTTLSE